MAATIYSEAATGAVSPVAAAQALKAEFARTAADVDERGEFPLGNMQRIFEAGLHRLLVSREYGGTAESNHLASNLRTIAEVITEISAGESSTAQAFMVHALMTRIIFSGEVDLPESTKRRLAHEILDEGARIMSSASEPGGKRESYRTTARRVPGGLLVNGNKGFNTGSDGSRYANVAVLHEGFPSVEEGGIYFALIPLDGPGVTKHHDWDNMGQRATASQSITYADVFVPDGFHYGWVGGGMAFYRDNNIMGLVSQVMLNAVILGMGFGALDATIDYVRRSDKTASQGSMGGAEDPRVRWHVGRHSALLGGARAIQREVASELEEFSGDPRRRAELSVHMMRAKYAILEAALTTSGEVHRIAGGRATSNSYRLDRFWRNARTLSVHDGIDPKLEFIGAFELVGEAPPVSWLN